MATVVVPIATSPFAKRVAFNLLTNLALDLTVSACVFKPVLEKSTTQIAALYSISVGVLLVSIFKLICLEFVFLIN